MEKPSYIYDIDEHPPVRLALIYGLQWAILIFPSMIILARLSALALHMTVEEEVRFLQLSLLTSGSLTVVQTLWGHRYPLIDGPSTALLLTFLIMAPYGIETIQGGMMLGGVLLIALVVSGRLQKVLSYATPNVVGVILMLIAFSLLPYLAKMMIGARDGSPDENIRVFLISVGLVFFMATLSHLLPGFYRTMALLFGIALGTIIFALLGHCDWRPIVASRWLSMPRRWSRTLPGGYWPALIAFGSAYVAVLVNSLGSLHGIAGVTDNERLPKSIPKGILINGLGGLISGVLGIVGTVSYSFSPGVVLANRVASRFALTYCGIILVVAAFIPKLSGLLALVPPPVVGAALCVALGAQIGAGMSIIASDGLQSRDYFVTGLPLILGTLVGFLPRSLLDSAPGALRVFLGNGLVVGILLVLLLEHLLLRPKAAGAEIE